MLILCLRTDNPEAELGLYNDDQKIDYVKWQAHRQLAETLHGKIKDILNKHDFNWNNIEAIAVYEGPGSFTGLRIGISVANALANSLKAPIVAATGDDWIEIAIKQLMLGKNQQNILPNYGAEPHITAPKH